MVNFKFRTRSWASPLNLHDYPSNFGEPLFAPRRAYLWLLFISCLLLPVPSLLKLHAETHVWTTYHNTRFGTTADVPPSWRTGPPPENNDGLVFTSPDGAATLTISGMLNIEDNLAAAFKFYETPEKGETITYKHRAGDAVTVSGTKGDRIFYAKHLLSCHNQIWNSIYLEYPAARKTAFDDLVAHVANSLRPGQGYQIENCNQ